VTLRDVEKFHDVPRQNLPLYRLPQEISMSRGPMSCTHRALKAAVKNDTRRIRRRTAEEPRETRRDGIDRNRIDEPAAAQNTKRTLMSARVRNHFPAARLDKRQEGLPRVFDSSFVRTFPLLHEDRFRLAYVREENSEYSGCGETPEGGRRTRYTPGSRKTTKPASTSLSSLSAASSPLSATMRTTSGRTSV